MPPLLLPDRAFGSRLPGDESKLKILEEIEIDFKKFKKKSDPLRLKIGIRVVRLIF